MINPLQQRTTPSTSTGNRMKEHFGIISTQPPTGPQQIESIQLDHTASPIEEKP